MTRYEDATGKVWWTRQVYVIDLEPAACRHRKSPSLQVPNRPVYVGGTALDPAERLQKHLVGIRRSKWTAARRAGSTLRSASGTASSTAWRLRATQNDSSAKNFERPGTACSRPLAFPLRARGVRGDPFLSVERGLAGIASRSTPSPRPAPRACRARGIRRPTVVNGVLEGSRHQVSLPGWPTPSGSERSSFSMRTRPRRVGHRAADLAATDLRRIFAECGKMAARGKRHVLEAVSRGHNERSPMEHQGTLSLALARGSAVPDRGACRRPAPGRYRDGARLRGRWSGRVAARPRGPRGGSAAPPGTTHSQSAARWPISSGCWKTRVTAFVSASTRRRWRERSTPTSRPMACARRWPCWRSWSPPPVPPRAALRRCPASEGRAAGPAATVASARDMPADSLSASAASTEGAAATRANPSDAAAATHRRRRATGRAGATRLLPRRAAQRPPRCATGGDRPVPRPAVRFGPGIPGDPGRPHRGGHGSWLGRLDDVRRRRRNRAGAPRRGLRGCSGHPQHPQADLSSPHDPGGDRHPGRHQASSTSAPTLQVVHHQAGLTGHATRVRGIRREPQSGGKTHVGRREPPPVVIRRERAVGDAAHVQAAAAYRQELPVDSGTVSASGFDDRARQTLRPSGDADVPARQAPASPVRRHRQRSPL